MKRAFYRSPYLWAAVAVAAVVTIAWAGRESYQPVITGTSAPDFAASDMSGKPVPLSDYRGRVVVLDFFGDW